MLLALLGLNGATTDRFLCPLPDSLGSSSLGFTLPRSTPFELARKLTQSARSLTGFSVRFFLFTVANFPKFPFDSFPCFDADNRSHAVPRFRRSHAHSAIPRENGPRYFRFLRRSKVSSNLSLLRATQQLTLPLRNLVSASCPSSTSSTPKPLGGR